MFIYLYPNLLIQATSKKSGLEEAIEKAEKALKQDRYYDAFVLLGPYKDKLPENSLKLFYMTPEKYLKHVIKHLPAKIKKYSAEEIRNFILLVFAIIHRESNFNPEAKSDAGAKGLMQLMPKTAESIAKKLGIKNPNLFDPETNIKIGLQYLADCIENNGGLDYRALILAAYNGGQGMTDNCLKKSNHNGKPFKENITNGETSNFIKIVNDNYKIYKNLYTQEIDKLVAKHFPTSPVVASKPPAPPIKIAKVDPPPKSTKKEEKVLYKVVVGIFTDKSGAEKRARELKSKGFGIYVAYTEFEDGRKGYRVQIGAFGKESQAKKYLNKVKKDYPESFIWKVAQ